MNNALVCEYCSTLMTERFTAIVYPNSFNGMSFYHFYKLIQNTKGLFLKVHHEGPHCPYVIINNSEKIFNTSNRCLFVGTPYVYMDQVKVLLSNDITNRKGEY